MKGCFRPLSGSPVTWILEKPWYIEGILLQDPGFGLVVSPICAEKKQ